MTWHVLIDGKQNGPFEADTVVQMIARGEVSAETLVWTAGIEDWTRAIDVPEFADNFDGAAPPAPQPLRYGAEAADEDDEGVPGRLNFGRIFSDAYKGLTARPGSTLLVTAVYAGLSLIATLPMYIILVPKLTAAAANPGDFEMSVFSGSDIAIYGVVTLISIALYGGLCAALIDLIRGDDISVARLFSGFARIVPLFLFVVIFTVLLIVGFILLVIPGFFVWAALILGMFIIMDRKVGALAGTKASFRAAARLGWFRMVGLFLLLIAMMFGIMFVYALLPGLGAGLFLAASTGADAGMFTQSITFNVIQTLLMSIVMVVYLAMYAAAYKQAEPHLDAT